MYNFISSEVLLSPCQISTVGDRRRRAIGSQQLEMTCELLTYRPQTLGFCHYHYYLSRPRTTLLASELCKETFEATEGWYHHTVVREKSLCESLDSSSRSWSLSGYLPPRIPAVQLCNICLHLFISTTADHGQKEWRCAENGMIAFLINETLLLYLGHVSRVPFPSSSLHKRMRFFRYAEVCCS